MLLLPLRYILLKSFSRKLYFFLACLFCIHDLRAQPVINSFSPASGPAGTVVTITGNNFSSIAANNFVYFGTAKAVVNAASSTSLLVIVPPNAVYQPISVTTNNLTAFSANPFAVTFNGGEGLSNKSFAKKVDSATGGSPYSTAIGDLDGDGKSDLVEVNGDYPYSVSVFRNTSIGGIISFAARQEFPAGYVPFDVAMTDFNGDGKLDLVIVNSGFGSQNIYILQNNSTLGSISFVLKGSYGTAADPTSVATGDLDGDGRPDIAVANFASKSVSVFKNTSVGNSISFDQKSDFTADSLPTKVAISDIDGDGRPDLAVSNIGSNDISILRNISTVGNILFFQKIKLPGGSGVTLGDLDGDLKPDLVCSSNQAVSVRRNISKPGLISFDANFDFPVSTPDNIAIADLDGDGKPDLAIENGGVSIIKNISSPGIISFAHSLDVESSSGSYIIVAGDLDGDGKPDLVSPNMDVNTISIYKNTVNGPRISAFTPANGGDSTTVNITGNNFTDAVFVGFGGTSARSFIVVSDTLIKAIVASGSSGNVIVTTPKGTATLAPFKFFPKPTISGFTPASAGVGAVITITGTNFTGTNSVLFGGLAADSFKVLSPTLISAVVGYGSTGSVTITTPGGSVTANGFSYASTPPVITDFAPSSGAVGSTVTIHGSGFSPVLANNIVYFGPVKATVQKAASSSLQVIVPVGASFQPITVTTTSRLTGYSLQPFNVTFSEPGKGFDENSFAPPVDVVTGYSPLMISSADLDGDGKPDLIVPNTQNGNGYASISVLKNTGSVGHISFASKLDYGSAYHGWMSCVKAADLNGDGKPDMVASGNDAIHDVVYVYLNNSTPGSIVLANPLKFTIGGDGGAGDMAIRDFDGDGKPDIVVVMTYWNGVLILRNTSKGDSISFAPPIPYFSGYNAQGLSLGDLDGDGKCDFSVANVGYTSRNASVFINTSTIGQISFTKTDITVDFPYTPQNSFIGDVNGDSKPELLVSNYDDHVVSIFPNNSSPGNIYFEAKSDLPAGNRLVRMANLDGDGKPDLMECSGWYLIIMRNTSAGNTISFDTALSYPSTGGIGNHLTGDMDGDGKADMIIANAKASTLSIFRNQLGNGSPPTITGFTPDTSYSGQTVTITGTRFTYATAVSFGGMPADTFTVVNDNKILAVVGNGKSGKVSVLTLSGLATDTGFVYTGPSIYSFSPIFGVTLKPITIRGINLSGTTAVSFGGIPARSFEVISDSVIIAVVGYGAEGTITVTTKKGYANIAGFFYTNLPVITSFTPKSGTTGTNVTIKGVNFTNTTKVSFENVPAASFSVLSDTVINAVVGSGATGWTMVFTATGSGYLGTFTYIEPMPPEVKSFTPVSGSPGTVVSIYGKHLLGTSSVSFGGTPAESFTVISDSVIEAVVNAGSTGYVKVTTKKASDSLAGFSFIPVTVHLLPFILFEFSGSITSGYASIQWKTLNEQTIVRYGLFSSADSITYIPIDDAPALKGAGLNNYTFKDASFHGRRTYYLLHAIDSSDNVVYSRGIAVGNLDSVLTSSIKIYPNPASGYVTILHPLSDVTSTISLVDYLGRVIQTMKVPENTTQAVFYFDTGERGLYNISWSDGLQTITQALYIR